MCHLIQKLLLSETWPSDRSRLGCKKGVHQVLLVCVEHGDSHVDHVVIRDSDLVQLAIILSEHHLSEEQFLLFHLDLRLNIDQTLEVFNGAVRLTFDVIKLVVFSQILDQKRDHCWLASGRLCP